MERQDMDRIVVYVTVPDEEQGVSIARALVNERLAACVNIVRSVRSIYRWEGVVQDDPELLLVIKTRRALFDALERRVRSMHPYTVPEVVALPIIEGSAPYIKWLDESTEG